MFGLLIYLIWKCIFKDYLWSFKCLVKLIFLVWLLGVNNKKKWGRIFGYRYYIKKKLFVRINVDIFLVLINVGR